MDHICSLQGSDGKWALAGQMISAASHISSSSETYLHDVTLTQHSAQAFFHFRNPEWMYGTSRTGHERNSLWWSLGEGVFISLPEVPPYPYMWGMEVLDVYLADDV